MHVKAFVHECIQKLGNKYREDETHKRGAEGLEEERKEEQKRKLEQKGMNMGDERSKQMRKKMWDKMKQKEGRRHEDWKRKTKN